MDSSTTQGTSRASMIILATVVFPEALPPPRPVGQRGAPMSTQPQDVPTPVPEPSTHRWQKLPWTECHAHCTKVAGRLCRWSSCWCAVAVALTCTGW